MAHNISIVRGTTHTYTIKVADGNGHPHTLGENQVLVFALKQNPKDEERILIKKLATANGGGYKLKLSASETQKLECGKYFYDIGMQDGEGDFYNIIEASVFEVRPNIAVLGDAIGAEVGGNGISDDDRVAYVTFMNGAEELLKYPVIKGDACREPVARGYILTPENNEMTAEYVKVFSGWATEDGGVADSNVLNNITADKTVYAAFEQEVRKYTITYFDDDGTTVLHTEQEGYGSTPAYKPTKSGYVLFGWTPEIAPVTGDASYVANWTTIAGMGMCGSNADWVLYRNGALVISGSGVIDNGGWLPVAEAEGFAITDIIVKNGIDTINSGCFDDYTMSANMTLPPSIRTIYDTIFVQSLHISDLAAWCNINRPTGGYVQGDYYVNGEKLTALFVVTGVTAIKNCAFKGCASLSSIKVGGSVTSIGEGAFSECSKLLSVSISDNVASIGEDAFSYCYALETVGIGENVTSIAKYAFTGCSTLSNAIFSDPDGWYVGDFPLASSNLVNATTAATYLKGTYVTRDWVKS